MSPMNVLMRLRSLPPRYLLILGRSMRLDDVPSLQKQDDSEVIEDGDFHSSIGYCAFIMNDILSFLF